MSLSSLQLAQRQIAESDFLAALATLESALQTSPLDPDLNAEYGLLLTFLQREFDALARLSSCSGSPGFDRLAQVLTDYAHARRQMAHKLGIEDEPGTKFQAELNRIAPNRTPSPGTGSRLTACLIVKNEEKTLARCLSSLQHVCDEIVVVDTGSTDQTIQIARSFGAKIGEFEWVQDFSAARNHSLSLATGNWILWIDADEELDPQGITMIQEGLMRPHFGGYFVKIINFMREGSRADQYVHTPVRLFQNRPDLRFTGSIHEQILPQILAAGLMTATLEGPTIWHYGYTAEMMQERNKEARTIELLQKELAENPDDSFQWFNLANVSAVAHQMLECERAAREAIRSMPPQAAHGSLTYYLLAYALIDLNRAAEALDVCDQAREAGYEDILIVFERAHALSVLGRLEEALVEADRLQTLEWPLGLNGDYGIFTHKKLTLNGQILAQMGRFDEALDWIDRSLAVDPDYRYANFLKGSILAQTGAGRAAVAFLESTFGRDGIGTKAYGYAGRALYDEGDWNGAHAMWSEALAGGETDPVMIQSWIVAAERMNHPENLIQTYAQASELIDLLPDHRVNWGRALVVQSRTQEAVRQFEAALEADSAHANASFNLADALYKLGEFDRSVESYQKALELQPTHSEGWFCFGNALAQFGAAPAAMIAYQQTLQLNPAHERAQHNLALLEAELAA